MLYRWIVAAMVVLTGMHAVCGQSARGVVSKADLEAVVWGGNAFGAELLSKVGTGDKSVFFSPYSIRTALAMTYAGARAKTAEQMAGVLHLGVPAERLHGAFGELIRDLNAGVAGDRDVGFRLVVANALWSQAGFPFQKDFEAVVQSNYGAGLQQVDFVGMTEDARRRINGWTAKQTNDKIQDLIPAGVLNNLTRLVLTNAVYFKSPWQHPFQKDATVEGSFHVTEDRRVDVAMMHQTERLGYMETELFQAVELPYAGGRMSMVVFVPRQIDGLMGMERGLTAGAMKGHLSQLKPRRVELSLPRFRVTSQFDLSAALRAMGMVDAFSAEAADFSGIADVRTLHIQAVMHKAFVDVKEEGTEAAAATAVVVGVRMSPVVESPVVVKVDRPFLFMIRDRASSQVLFMGHVVNPAE